MFYYLYVWLSKSLLRQLRSVNVWYIYIYVLRICKLRGSQVYIHKISYIFAISVLQIDCHICHITAIDLTFVCYYNQVVTREIETVKLNTLDECFFPQSPYVRLSLQFITVVTYINIFNFYSFFFFLLQVSIHNRIRLNKLLVKLLWKIVVYCLHIRINHFLVNFLRIETDNLARSQNGLSYLVNSH